MIAVSFSDADDELAIALSLSFRRVIGIHHTFSASPVGCGFFSEGGSSLTWRSKPISVKNALGRRTPVNVQKRRGEASATAQGLFSSRASSAFVALGLRGLLPVGRVWASLKRGDRGRESEGRRSVVIFSELESVVFVTGGLLALIAPFAFEVRTPRSFLADAYHRRPFCCNS